MRALHALLTFFGSTVKDMNHYLVVGLSSCAKLALDLCQKWESHGPRKVNKTSKVKIKCPEKEAKLKSKPKFEL